MSRSSRSSMSSRSNFRSFLRRSLRFAFGRSIGVGNEGSCWLFVGRTSDCQVEAQAPSMVASDPVCARVKDSRFGGMIVSTIGSFLGFGRVLKRKSSELDDRSPGWKSDSSKFSSNGGCCWVYRSVNEITSGISLIWKGRHTPCNMDRLSKRNGHSIAHMVASVPGMMAKACQYSLKLAGCLHLRDMETRWDLPSIQSLGDHMPEECWKAQMTSSLWGRKTYEG